MSQISKRQLKKRKRIAQLRGRLAETYAASYLRLKGYRILARHYRRPFGEIDIIAFKRETVVAIEVKTRKTRSEALYSIGPVQKRRIKRTLEAFVIERSKLQSLNIRFDALLVTSFLKRPEHIKNAWD